MSEDTYWAIVVFAGAVAAALVWSLRDRRHRR